MGRTGCLVLGQFQLSIPVWEHVECFGGQRRHDHGSEHRGRYPGTWTGGLLSTNGLHQFEYGFVEVTPSFRQGKAFGRPSGCMGELIVGRAGYDGISGWRRHPRLSVHARSSGAQNQVAPTSTNWTSATTCSKCCGSQVRSPSISITSRRPVDNELPAEPMYLMLNFDVGRSHDWGGVPNGSTPTTAQFNVAHVRVYQQS